MFEIVNTTDDSPGKESLGRLHSPSGYKDICLTSSFYALLNEDPDDVRLNLLEYSSKRAFVKKYQPQDEEDIMDANIPLIRLSEAYLNAAEAAVKPVRQKKEAYANNMEILRLCRKYDVPIILGSDAHISFDVANYEYALPLIAESQFPEELIVNDKPEMFLEYIHKTL